jgi:plasmid stability protein
MRTGARGCTIVCMRATINLPDALADAAKQRARSEGRTLTSLVEEGLRTVLAHEERPAKVDPLPAYGDARGRFLVDINDHDALWAALDADDRR